MSANKRRFVLDTNVLVSAFLFDSSPPGRALRWVRSHGTLLLSDQTVDELAGVLSRKKLDRYVLRSDRDDFVAALLRDGEMISVTERVAACRDSKDDKLLELALDGRADAIVTGDGDLLALHPFRGLVILAPAVFLERILKG